MITGSVSKRLGRTGFVVDSSLDGWSNGVVAVDGTTSIWVLTVTLRSGSKIGNGVYKQARQFSIIHDSL